MPPRRKPKVVKFRGPVVLEFASGYRLKLSLIGGRAPSKGPRRRPGRPPSPATQALLAALQKAAKAGKVLTRTDSVEILRKAGHKGPLASAQILALRAEIRAFGHSLAGKRAAGGRKRLGKGTGSEAHGKAGRKPSPETLLLRERIATDNAASNLNDPSTYVRWLVDQPGIKLGLQQARLIVYRELRRARK